MNIEELIIDYENGESLASLGRKHNCTANKIKNLLLVNKIRIRSAKEQTIFTNQAHKKKVNDNIYNVLTKENMWLVGFIASDGTIRSNRNEIKISLSTKDREILEKIKKMLNVEREIHDYTTSNNFDVSELAFSSKTIKDKLINFGIKSNKTYCGISLINIPNEFKINFIHGYFDGDGSISIRKDNQVVVKIIGYYEENLREIAEYLKKYHDINFIGIYQDKRRESLYSLEYSTLNAIKLCKLFYEDNQSSALFLQRKYNKFLETKRI